MSNNNITAQTSIFKRPLLATVTAALLVSISLTGCSSNTSETDDTKVENHTADEASNVADNDAVSVKTIEVDTVRGDVSLPINPAPLVVYDMTLLQDLAALDVAVAGVPSDLPLDNLHSETQPDPEEVGTVFEPDLEA